MKKQRVKTGIIGTGFIGAAHIEALRRIGICDVIAVADINLDLAKKIARRWDIPLTYERYEDLIKNPDIDVVHIATPNNLHYPVAELAIRSGKHVVCEKPLVLNTKEAKALLEIAGNSNCVTAVSFNLRYYPLVQQARKMVQGNSLGRIFSYHGRYLQDWLLFDTDYSWRVDSSISGPTRAISDIGSHWLDMAEYILGQRVAAVCADIRTFHPVRKKPKASGKTFQKASEDQEYENVEIDTEDYAALLIRFENDVPGTLTISQASAGRKNYLEFEVDGEKKALSWNSENPNEMWIGKRDSFNQLLIKDPSLVDEGAAQFISFPGGHTEGFPDTQKQLFKQVYEYIQEENHIKGIAAPFPTFKDGCHIVALSEAILQSARSHALVEL